MKKLVENLRAPESIQEFMAANNEWSQTRARQLGIVAKFVTTQALLHLPYYEESQITGYSSEVLRDIDEKVVALGEDYSEVYDRLYGDTEMSLVTAHSSLQGKNILSLHDGVGEIPVKFDEVPKYLATEMNSRLHYIRSARNDSIADYGLYIDEASTPYAIASFSRCNRGYQVDALNNSCGLSLEPEEVFSMTRAFTFNNAPKNSMSKLFHQSQTRIKQVHPEVKAIVTALNPYTGFDGGVFMGASYTPYALSPMEYWYNKKGFYVPRSKGVQPQKTATPPIIWLAHGMDKRTAKVVESLNSDISNITIISQDEYRRG